MTTLWLFLQNFEVQGDGETRSALGDLTWAITDDSELLRSGTCDFEKFSDVVDEELDEDDFESTNLLIEDTLTLYLKQQVPGRTNAQVRQAVPYAIEDHLSNEIDELHIATGVVARNKPVECLAIEREALQVILETLAESEIYPTFCTTIGQQIPLTLASEHEVQIVPIGSLIWVRTQDQIAVIDQSILEEVLAQLVRATEDEEAKQFQLHSYDGEALLTLSDELTELTQIFEHERSFLQWIVDEFNPQECINLLQGSFINENIDVRLDVKKWVKTSMLAGIIGVSYLVLLLAEGTWAMIQADQLENQARDLYESIYDERPRANRNVELLMRSKMGIGSAVAQQFNFLLKRLADVVGEEKFSSIELNSVRFQSAQQNLSTEFEIRSLDDIDAFVAALEADGRVSVRFNTGDNLNDNRARANITMSLIQ